MNMFTMIVLNTIVKQVMFTLFTDIQRVSMLTCPIKHET